VSLTTEGKCLQHNRFETSLVCRHRPLHDWAAKRERGINAPGPHHLRLSDRHRRWVLKDVQDWLDSTRV